MTRQQVLEEQVNYWAQQLTSAQFDMEFQPNPCAQQVEYRDTCKENLEAANAKLEYYLENQDD